MTIVYRIATQIFNTPLLVTPDVASAIACALADRFGIDAQDPGLSGFDASRFVGTPRGPRDSDGSIRNMYRVEGGVALVSVMGELVNRGAWIGASSGLTSYEGFDAQLDAIARDETVHAVVLDMNTPGGQASGAMESAARVRRLSAQKPVVAFINGMAASAGYAIAAGATRIVATPSAQLGSVGVVWMHLDRSAQIEKAGLRPTILTAGAFKADGHGMAALPDDARQRIQAQIDAVYTLFVDTVAAFRPLTAEAVRATEARIYMGQAAVDAGLADSLGGLDDVLASLDCAPRHLFPTGGKAVQTRGFHMTDTITRDDHDAAVAAARREGTDAGASAERTRISAILDHEYATGREKLAKHFAFQTSMPADQALAALEASPATEPAVSPLSAAMSMQPQPQTGPGGERSLAPQPKTINASSIYAHRAAQSGHRA